MKENEIGSREIKFKYYFQHEETGCIFSEIFTLEELAGFKLRTWMNIEIPRYYFIGKSEFTGLKDKKGVEIFEGDIIQEWFDFSSPAPIRATDIRKRDVFVVEYDDFQPSFVLVDRTKPSYLGVKYDWDNCGQRTLEIIGNIFENKSLIS